MSTALNIFFTILGVLIGYLLNERLTSRKFRLNLRERIIKTNQLYNSTVDLLKSSYKSHLRAASALHTIKGGSMGKWLEKYNIDIAILKSLEDALPDTNKKFIGLKSSLLDDKLVRVYDLNNKIETLANFYLEYNRKDEELLREHRSQHNKMVDKIVDGDGAQKYTMSKLNE